MDLGTLLRREFIPCVFGLHRAEYVGKYERCLDFIFYVRIYSDKGEDEPDEPMISKRG